MHVKVYRYTKQWKLGLRNAIEFKNQTAWRQEMVRCGVLKKAIVSTNDNLTLRQIGMACDDSYPTYNRLFNKYCFKNGANPYYYDLFFFYRKKHFHYLTLHIKHHQNISSIIQILQTR